MHLIPIIILDCFPMLVVHSWYSICIRLFPMLFIHFIVMSLCRACPVCAVSTILLLPHCFWVPLQVSTCTHSHISSLKSVKMQRNLLIIITMPLTISIGFNVMLYCYIWVVNFKICIIAAPLYLCYILFSCFYRSSLGEYTIINNKKELASKPAIKAVCPWNNNIFCSFLLIFTYIL